MRGNSVRVVLSPSVMGAVTRGFTRALGENTSVSKNEKDALSLDMKTIYPGEVQSTEQEVTTFVDNDAGDSADIVNISMNPSDTRSDATLRNFLSRPALVHSIVWSEGGGIDTTFNVWKSFFSNSVITNKLQNYNFISCSLKLKVVINASPFYYGLAGLFYEPLTHLNTAKIVSVPGYSGDLVPLSQRQHLWLYPANSQGGDMTLPYFNNTKWLDITSDTDVTNFGQIRVKSVVPLYNANAVSGSNCSIQIYAWAEDVQLAGPTYSAALQSSDQVDPKLSHKHIENEYDDSPKISSIASSISRAAAEVSVLPAPFGTVASGVSLVTGAISSVASMFGFTNTPVVDDVQGFKNLPYHCFSSSEISTPVDRLTYDPKNILTDRADITGSVLGDELNIKNFCSRESYLTQFPWQAAETLDTVLFGAVVHPAYMRRDGASNYTWQMTPMALPNYMFEYWRGTIVYRFRFICSKYHRGRVRITWDPKVDLTSATDTKVSNYNRIVDLAEETDVSVEIPFLQKTDYLQTNEVPDEYFANTTLPAPADGVDNGQISVRVLNSQTSPVLNADIICVVSVYGKDMEFAGPRHIVNDFTAYPLQSVDQYAEGKTSVELFEKTTTPDDLNQLYMGENISSFYQIMKRTNYHGSVFFNADNISTLRMNKSSINRFPRYPGFDPNGYYQGREVIGPGYAPYNFVKWVPLTWIGQCFVACRGSITWHANACGGSPITSLRALRRVNPIAISSLSGGTAVATGSTDSVRASWTISNLFSGNSGSSLTNQNTQSALSINAPFYSLSKFRSTSAATATLGLVADGTLTDNLSVEAIFTPELDIQSGDMRFDYYVASGPDLNLKYFLNVPSLVEIPSVPAGEP